MLVNIFDSFKDLSLFGWISQILGIIGFILIGTGYLFPKRKFLLFATGAHVFFLLESAFAFLLASVPVAIISVIRNVIACILLYKFNKEVPNFVNILLMVIMIASVLIIVGINNSWAIWDNYLPASIVIMVTFTQNSKNEYIVKGGGVLCEIGYLTFYLIHNLPFSIIRQIILVTAGIVGFILLVIKSKGNNKKHV